MSPSEVSAPQHLPILSRGKHRNPRKGACLMELVSYLAGERWSDQPSCTHPLLGRLARHVNDAMSDEARPQLAVLVPTLIGLVSDDLHVDARIALRCARAALPVVAADRQGAMAVAILACEGVLDDLDDRPAGSLEEVSLEALEQAPHAATWGRQFARGQRVSAAGFRRHAAPNIVSCAVKGIAQACVPNVDERLHDLLAGAIDDCRTWAAPEADAATTLDTASWDEACRLTGSAPSG
jgi:hypothetical protein